jgi:hypothetical protein
MHGTTPYDKQLLTTTATGSNGNGGVGPCSPFNLACSSSVVVVDNIMSISIVVIVHL